jgi:hypothetical protein
MFRKVTPLVLSILIVSVLGISTLFALGDASDPAAQSAVLPSPAESGMPEKIVRKEIRRIRREFTDLLDQERDRLRAEQTRRRRDGDASRKIRKRDWEAKEKDGRRKFFDENAHGPMRRDYVRELIERRKAFYEELKTEERNERNELDVRWKALKESQRTRLNAVEEVLRRSERPTSRLLERAD